MDNRTKAVNMNKEDKVDKTESLVETRRGVEGEYQELTLGNWLMTFLIMDVPIIGYIVLLVGAFGKKSPEVKKSMCKAYLIKKLIFTTLSIVILVILFYIGSYWLDKVLEYMQQL